MGLIRNSRERDVLVIDNRRVILVASIAGVFEFVHPVKVRAVGVGDGVLLMEGVGVGGLVVDVKVEKPLPRVNEGLEGLSAWWQWDPGQSSLEVSCEGMRSSSF